MPDVPPPAADQATVDAVAGELYALDPDRFVAARDAASKQLQAAGQRPEAAVVKALRRPSMVGWALNLLVREDRVQVDSLLSLGDELRRAQDRLSGVDLRRLTAQRHQVVRAVAARAGDLAEAAGRPLSATVVEQVARSLDAALADPAVAADLVAGQVTGELSYAGLGIADAGTPTLSVVRGGDPDAAGAPASKSSAAEHRQALRAAQRAVSDAAEEAQATEDRLARAQESAQAANLRAASAAQTVETIEAQYETAKAELEAAQHEEEVAERAVELAAKTHDRATRRLAAAEDALADLTPNS